MLRMGMQKVAKWGEEMDCRLRERARKPEYIVVKSTESLHVQHLALRT
jgi:hypothetical protein